MHSSCQGWISNVYEIIKSTAELADLKKSSYRKSGHCNNYLQQDNCLCRISYTTLFLQYINSILHFIQCIVNFESWNSWMLLRYSVFTAVSQIKCAQLFPVSKELDTSAFCTFFFVSLWSHYLKIHFGQLHCIVQHID